MQQIHLIVIKYLTLLVLNKQKLATIIPHLSKHKQQNPKYKSYNMLPKPTQIAQIKG